MPILQEGKQSTEMPGVLPQIRRLGSGQARISVLVPDPRVCVLREAHQLLQDIFIHLLAFRCPGVSLVVALLFMPFPPALRE